MSDRKITADEAKRLLQMAGNPSLSHYATTFRGQRSHSIKSETGKVRAHVGYGVDGGTAYADAELFAAAPDLARAVIDQAEEIADLDEQNERLSTDLFKVTRQRNRFRDEARSPMFPPMPEPADNVEVVRLRREMEELVIRLTANWKPGTRYEKGLDSGYRYAAYELNRILGGDNK